MKNCSCGGVSEITNLFGGRTEIRCKDCGKNVVVYSLTMQEASDFWDRFNNDSEN